MDIFKWILIMHEVLSEALQCLPITKQQKRTNKINKGSKKTGPYTNNRCINNTHRHKVSNMKRSTIFRFTDQASCSLFCRQIDSEVPDTLYCRHKSNITNLNNTQNNAVDTKSNFRKNAQSYQQNLFQKTTK